MTAPIPLAAPDGRIYAYACGTCHVVAGGSTPMWIEDPPGPHRGIAEWSRTNAERCCTCWTCHTPLPRGGLLRITCATCLWWDGFRSVWRRIGAGETGTPCKVCGSDEAYCRDRKLCTDCGEEHASNADGRCRDCNLEAIMRRTDG